MVFIHCSYCPAHQYTLSALMLSSAMDVCTDDLRAMTHDSCILPDILPMTWPNLPGSTSTRRANSRPVWTVGLLNTFNWCISICQTLAMAKDLVPPPVFWLRRTSEVNNIYIQYSHCPAHQNTLSALMLSSAMDVCFDDLRAMTHDPCTLTLYLWPDLIYLSDRVSTGPTHVRLGRTIW